MTRRRTMTIGTLAKQASVNIETVRFYERCRLLAPSSRKPSGYRLYTLAELRRLRFIKQAQTWGFSLHEVEELLNLRVSSSASCPQVKQRTQAKLAEVEKKIDDLAGCGKTLVFSCFLA
jgi:DNA-binding transcriptional MerR regulator